MLFFNFMIRMLCAVNGMENKVDKRGKEFLSLKFDKYGQGHSAWIKSVVMYQPNKKGNISILVNHGGTRADTGLEFPMSTTLVLKRVNEELFLILKKGKVMGFASQVEVDQIRSATPQPIRKVTSDSMF